MVCASARGYRDPCLRAEGQSPSPCERRVMAANRDAAGIDVLEFQLMSPRISNFWTGDSLTCANTDAKVRPSFARPRTGGARTGVFWCAGRAQWWGMTTLPEPQGNIRSLEFTTLECVRSDLDPTIVGGGGVGSRKSRRDPKRMNGQVTTVVLNQHHRARRSSRRARPETPSQAVATPLSPCPGRRRPWPRRPPRPRPAPSRAGLRPGVPGGAHARGELQVSGRRSGRARCSALR